jgi:hypothetical protein
MYFVIELLRGKQRYRPEKKKRLKTLAMERAVPTTHDKIRIRRNKVTLSRASKSPWRI